MILCHIVGINNLTKKRFINDITDKYMNIYICDLDKITNSILNNKRMDILINEMKNTKSALKQKDIENEINNFWKEYMKKQIDLEINNNNKKLIIIIGLSIFYLNHKAKININTKNKFFLDVDVKQNANEIVEYNLNEYNEHIVNGTFPIMYLDHDFLINQREKLIKLYKNNKYDMKDYNKLFEIIDILLKDYPNCNDNDNIIIWVSSFNRYNEFIEESNDNGIVGYKDEWLSLISIIKDNNKLFKKGYINNDNNKYPYIQERILGAFKYLNKSAYIYELKSNKYNRVNNFKYNILNDRKFMKRILVNNIYNYLEDNGVKLIKFKY